MGAYGGPPIPSVYYTQGHDHSKRILAPSPFKSRAPDSDSVLSRFVLGSIMVVCLMAFGRARWECHGRVARLFSAPANPQGEIPIVQKRIAITIPCAVFCGFGGRGWCRSSWLRGKPRT